MTEGIINLWRITITHIKEKWSVKTEIVGKDKQTVENSPFYKRKAIRAANFDPNLDKYDTDKFTFEAELLQNMD